MAVDIGTKFGSPIGTEDGYGIADLTSIVLSNAIAIAGVLLLFLLIFGGFSIIMGAGRSDPDQAAKGQQAATAAVAGFAIIFFTYWIVKIIETITGLDILVPPLP